MQNVFKVVPYITDDPTFNINYTLRDKALLYYQERFEKNQTTDSIRQGLNYHAFFTFDAVWAMLTALNDFQTNDDFPRLNKTYDCFTTSLQSSRQFIDALRRVQFRGIATVVNFTKTPDKSKNDGFYGLYQLTTDGMRNETHFKIIDIWNNEKYSWSEIPNSNKSWPFSDLNAPKDYAILKGSFSTLLKTSMKH